MCWVTFEIELSQRVVLTGIVRAVLSRDAQLFVGLANHQAPQACLFSPNWFEDLRFGYLGVVPHRDVYLGCG